MGLFTTLKFLHVLFAVIAVGFNASYGFWFARARKDSRNLTFILKNISVMDRFIANPAYMGLAVTGPLMVGLGGYSWHAFWIWMSAFLLVLAAVLGIVVYSPLLKNQIRALEKKGFNSREYKALERQSTQFGMALWILVTVIIFLMVAKIQF
jgi:uncharacterized membrane protein